MEAHRTNSLRVKLVASFLFLCTLASGHSVSLHDARLYQLLRLQRFDLESFKGKKPVVVFFQPDCPPCREQMKSLKCLKEKHPTVEILAVGVGEQAALVKEVRPLALNFPSVESTPKFVEMVDGISATPHTLFLNEMGFITSREDGTRPCEEWEKIARAKKLF